MAPTVPQLEDFNVSETYGFLLDLQGLELPKEFEPWTKLNAELRSLLESHELRKRIDAMPLLDYKLLKTYREKRLAFTILTYFGNGYVWQDGMNGSAKTVPSQLAVPWCRLGSDLGMECCISQATAVLSNWTRPDRAKPLDLDNMECIGLFPGGITADWFQKVLIQVEMDAAHGLKGIVEAQTGVAQKDDAAVQRGLAAITDSLKQMITSTRRMNDAFMKPEVFYHVYRVFVNGWGGEGSPYPDGLVFEGVSDKPKQVCGSSAAQSSTIQSFDAALGVTHETAKQTYLESMRKFMPPAHVDFILAVWKRPCIRDYVIMPFLKSIRDTTKESKAE